MSAFTQQSVNNFLRLWSVRGPQIIKQLQVALSLMQSSPVDLSPVLGPVVLLEESYSRVQRTISQLIMDDAVFATFTLELQDQIARSATSWSELFATTGNIAFYDRLPNLQALISTTPSAQLYSAEAQAIATSVETKIEQFLAVPTLAGLTVQTFWSVPLEAVEALSRLLTIDLVVSSDPTVYYGPNATISNIIDDALLVLSRIGPLVPSADAILAQINAAVASGYTESSAVSITSISVPQSASLQQIALQVYGDPDLMQQLADFNGLMYPYISDNLLDKLGLPKQLGLTLVSNAAVGATSVQVKGLGVFTTDDRLLVMFEDDFQVVTITDGAFTSPSKPVDWDTLAPSSYDLESITYTLTISPPLTDALVAANTKVVLYPPVYDTGIVLGTGDTLLIPNTLNQRRAFVVDNSFTDAQRLGTDAKTDQNGDLSLTNGDLKTVTGLDNLRQALGNRFKVERGSLIRHLSYGTQLRSDLGKRVRPALSFLAVVDATQTALLDPRVDGVENAVAVAKQDTISISFNVRQSNGILLFPTNLEISVPA